MRQTYLRNPREEEAADSVYSQCSPPIANPPATRQAQQGFFV